MPIYLETNLAQFMPLHSAGELTVTAFPGSEARHGEHYGSAPPFGIP